MKLSSQAPNTRLLQLSSQVFSVSVALPVHFCPGAVTVNTTAQQFICLLNKGLKAWECQQSNRGLPSLLLPD